ncbi:MAG: hypothetical protein U0169_11420 [Polyangiaceae bacterium]
MTCVTREPKFYGVTPKPTQDDVPPSEETSSGTDERNETRKERVIHTRVPAVLERELKRFAENMRVPVSNLIRTILEDAVSVADVASSSVEVKLGKAAEQIHRERERIKEKVRIDPLRDVLAFQEVTLAQPCSCAKCGKDLSPGDRAHLGLVDGPPRLGRIFACDDCIPRR